MSRYINNLFCLFATFIASNIISIVYELNTAFAATQICGTHVSTVRDNNYCQSGNYYNPNSGSKCGTYWRDLCRGAGAAWSCEGTIYNASSGYCNCSSLTYYTEYPQMSVGDCGTVWQCGGSGGYGTNIAAECNTGGNDGQAGYETSSGILSRRDCICCPEMLLVDRGTVDIFSNEGATAASDCYAVAKLQDETGLYEYTDANRCYYAS